MFCEAPLPKGAFILLGWLSYYLFRWYYLGYLMAYSRVAIDKHLVFRNLKVVLMEMLGSQAFCQGFHVTNQPGPCFPW
jgi:hypothetical protein